MEQIEAIKLVSDLQSQIEIAEEELNSLKLERFRILLSMKGDGVPLRVIGAILGVSRERARQLLDNYELQVLRANLPKD